MKKLYFTLLFVLFAVVGSMGQAPHGIRITSDVPIEVYLNGAQVSYPAQSVMICNLKRGSFLLEAFTKTREGRSVRGERVYRERLFYSGNDVMDVHIEASIEHVGISRPPQYYVKRPFQEEEFTLFLESIKAESLEKNKLALLEISTKNSGFFVHQAVEIAKLFNFDSGKLDAMKIIYPNLVDKENSFLIFNVFSFSSNKQKFIDFVNEEE